MSQRSQYGLFGALIALIVSVVLALGAQTVLFTGTILPPMATVTGDNSDNVPRNLHNYTCTPEKFKDDSVRDFEGPKESPGSFGRPQAGMDGQKMLMFVATLCGTDGDPAFGLKARGFNCLVLRALTSALKHTSLKADRPLTRAQCVRGITKLFNRIDFAQSYSRCNIAEPKGSKMMYAKRVKGQLELGITTLTRVRTSCYLYLRLNDGTTVRARYECLVQPAAAKDDDPAYRQAPF